MLEDLWLAQEFLMPNDFKSGDVIIYRKQKRSTQPASRAGDICPAPLGEDYSYRIDKFWVVVAIQPDRNIVARTRRGSYTAGWGGKRQRFEYQLFRARLRPPLLLPSLLGAYSSPSNSNLLSASRLPIPRTATRAASCSLRGRVLPFSQL